LRGFLRLKTLISGAQRDITGAEAHGRRGGRWAGGGGGGGGGVGGGGGDPELAHGHGHGSGRVEEIFSRAASGRIGARVGRSMRLR
jgi:hypothetical protein